MTRAQIIEIGGLYLPIFFSALLIWWRPLDVRKRVAVVFSIMWNLSLLPIVDVFCQRCEFWEFHSSHIIAWKMPLSLYLGWSVIWGVLMPLLFDFFCVRLPVYAAITLVLLIAFFADLLIMPQLGPLLDVNSGWLLGEGILLGICLLPGLILYEITRCKKYPLMRGLMIAISFVTMILIVLPFSTQSIVIVHPQWMTIGLVCSIALALVPAFCAVWVFAKRGGGTPLPFDPPEQLVTSGIYRWLVNPMQVSMIVAMLLCSWLYMHVGLAIASVSVWLYSMSLARWSESVDLTARYGEQWVAYRKNTPAWWPRLRRRKL